MLTNADGARENVYVVADSAKVVDGRLTTASPPFPGVDWPVKRAVICTPGAMNFVSYSDENGHYAAFAEIAQEVPDYPCRPWGLTAINPYTMYRVTSNVQICDGNNNIIHDFNIKLGGVSDAAPSDKTPPVISMNLEVVPGQENSPNISGT